MAIPVNKIKPNDARPNILGAIALLLFIGTVIYLTIALGINERLEGDLKKERLHAELRLSEKLQEQKKRVALQTDFKTLEERYSIVDHQLTHVQASLSESQSLVRRQQKEIDRLHVRASIDASVALKQKIKDDSIKHLDQLTTLLQLVEKAQTAQASSEAIVVQYRDQLYHQAHFRTNDVSVESRRKKDRLTVKAARTKSIKVSLNVSNQLSDFDVTIIAPSGEVLPVDKKNMSIRLEENITADKNISTDSIGRRNIEIIYKPVRRLEAGRYRIRVESENNLLGNFMVRLD